MNPAPSRLLWRDPVCTQKASGKVEGEIKWTYTQQLLSVWCHNYMTDVGRLCNWQTSKPDFLGIAISCNHIGHCYCRSHGCRGLVEKDRRQTQTWTCDQSDWETTDTEGALTLVPLRAKLAFSRSLIEHSVSSARNLLHRRLCKSTVWSNALNRRHNSAAPRGKYFNCFLLRLRPILPPVHVIYQSRVKNTCCYIGNWVYHVVQNKEFI